MDICFERYFELSRNEYSKIKKFIDNNIDFFESIFAPTHSFADLYRYYPFKFHSIFLPPYRRSIKNYDKCVDSYRHYIKNYDKYVCIIERNSFDLRNSYGLRNIAKSYFNIYYIKFFYLLQKVTKLNISNINRHILEKNIYKSL